MSTLAPVRRRFEARPEPADGLPDRWVVWDGLVGRTLSKLIICDGEEEARHLAGRLNSAWRETVGRRIEALAGDEEWVAYIEGIGA